MAGGDGLRRGAGEWMIPDDKLAESRRPPPPANPVEATDIAGDALADLLASEGPVVVLDGDAAREAWDALEADLRIGTRSATGTSGAMHVFAGAEGPRKLLLLDCTEGGITPEMILRTIRRDVRVGILAGPSTRLSAGAAEGVRVVRVGPAPTPAP